MIRPATIASPCTRAAAARPCGTLSRRATLAMAVAALAAHRGGPVAAAESDEAIAFVDRLGKQTVAILDDQSVDKATRIDRLVTILNEATDLPLVAKLVLGRYWRDATDPQRDDYVRLFKALAIKAMAERLNRYGGESFEIVGARKADDRDTVVATRIRFAGGGTPYAVDWRIREDHGRLAVVDIVAEGISLVITQRSEVNEIVSRRGLDGLLAAMRDRLAAPA